MLTVFVFVMNVFSLPGVILICCSVFYFAVTVVGHRIPGSLESRSSICYVLSSSEEKYFEALMHAVSQKPS